MSNLTFTEKRRFEQLLGMETGYVLDFTNRSFAEFVRDSTGRDIYDARYNYESGSKANRLRAFWQKEENSMVGKLMGDMLDYAGGNTSQQEICRLIVARLLKDGADPVSQADAGQKEPSSVQRQRSLALAQLKEEILRACRRQRPQPGRPRPGKAAEPAV